MEGGEREKKICFGIRWKEHLVFFPLYLIRQDAGKKINKINGWCRVEKFKYLLPSRPRRMKPDKVNYDETSPWKKKKKSAIWKARNQKLNRRGAAAWRGRQKMFAYHLYRLFYSSIQSSRVFSHRRNFLSLLDVHLSFLAAATFRPPDESGAFFSERPRERTAQTRERRIWKEAPSQQIGVF